MTQRDNARSAWLALLGMGAVIHPRTRDRLWEMCEPDAEFEEQSQAAADARDAKEERRRRDNQFMAETLRKAGF